MLEGIRVIEMATYIAAPGAGGILADWGAEVIKVEPLSGCPMRNFFKSVGVDHLKGNPVFDLDNRGKRSVALNTATPEGVEAIKRLVKDADVFLTNVRPGGLERAGLDYESLKKVNPKLVYATVSGYGLQGPDRDRPGFDMAAFYARSGLGAITTPKGQEPAPLRTAVGDHTTSMATTAGILGALLERQRTGKGRLVEASLLRTGIYALGSDMSIQLKFGKLGSTKSRHEAINPLNNFFKTSDGIWIAIIPRQGSVDWDAICKAIGQPKMIEDPRFKSSRDRRANGTELVDILDAAFAQHDLEYWTKALDEQDMVWAPMMPPADVAADPQAEAAGAFFDVPENDGSGTFRAPASPIRFGGEGEDAHPRGPSPDLGQHTLDVLKEFGYSEADIAGLQKSGTIA
ncbi:L-carnitine dehydratase/bile acid-inducible protein F [Tepidicaulis marinus]|uniref:L-carnitine dehydratase/bile acid-inducible protein F n=1 Tax=Tepidicaulis marinus TaxID=1333998 RepID=A0A081BD93_9HYPH|nr:CaiB/BaiF CoA-transferase family protein [Tepidicaulis marinus]GAK46011.1 L-carnitine dehydratase/bile acid-inducible protein F [Tepidicaulis marinus]